MGKEEGGCTGNAAKNGGLAVGSMPLGSRSLDGGPEGGLRPWCLTKAWVLWGEYDCKWKEVEGEYGRHNWFGAALLE